MKFKKSAFWYSIIADPESSWVSALTLSLTFGLQVFPYLVIDFVGHLWSEFSSLVLGKMNASLS